MPCTDMSHTHAWPTSGTLTIERCERYCGYCTGPAAKKVWKFAWFLRRHAAIHTQGPEADYPNVQVTEGWTRAPTGHPKAAYKKQKRASKVNSSNTPSPAPASPAPEYAASDQSGQITAAEHMTTAPILSGGDVYSSPASAGPDMSLLAGPALPMGDHLGVHGGAEYDAAAYAAFNDTQQQPDFFCPTNEVVPLVDADLFDDVQLAASDTSECSVFSAYQSLRHEGTTIAMEKPVTPKSRRACVKIANGINDVVKRVCAEEDEEDLSKGNVAWAVNSYNMSVTYGIPYVQF